MMITAGERYAIDFWADVYTYCFNKMFMLLIPRVTVTFVCRDREQFPRSLICFIVIGTAELYTRFPRLPRSLCSRGACSNLTKSIMKKRQYNADIKATLACMMGTEIIL